MWSSNCLSTQQAVWKKFLFSKHNFEIILFSGPSWHFCSPECIQIMIRGLVLRRNDQYFSYKIWPLIKIRDIYASIIWMPKSKKKNFFFTFRSPSGARDFQTPCFPDRICLKFEILKCLYKCAVNNKQWLVEVMSSSYQPEPMMTKFYDGRRGQWTVHQYSVGQAEIWKHVTITLLAFGTGWYP